MAVCYCANYIATLTRPQLKMVALIEVVITRLRELFYFSQNLFLTFGGRDQDFVFRGASLRFGKN